MIHLILSFLGLAVVAGIFGFSGVQIISVDIAKILFFIFLALFAISLVYRLLTGRRPPL